MLAEQYQISYDEMGRELTISVTGEELREILGDGDVTVVLSLPEETEETEEVPAT